MHRFLNWLLKLLPKPKSAVWQDGDKAYMEGYGEDSNPYYAKLNRDEWLDGYYGR